MLAVEKSVMLQEMSENLRFPHAQIMFKVVIIIRKQLSESANKPLDDNGNTGDVNMEDLFGLKLEYHSAVVLDSETHHNKMPVENTVQNVGCSSRKCKNEETEPIGATVVPKFNKAE